MKRGKISGKEVAAMAFAGVVCLFIFQQLMTATKLSKGSLG